MVGQTVNSFPLSTTVELRSFRPTSEIIDDMRQAVARLGADLPLHGTGRLEQMLGYAWVLQNLSQAKGFCIGQFDVLI